MSDLVRYTKPMLGVLTVLHLGTVVRSTWTELGASSGLAHADGSPLGGDFVNMLVAAKLMLAGRMAEIYQPEMFMAFERSLVPTDVGLRLWAYPPHSLLFVWPLGYLDYWAGFILWSALGLAVLICGARRAGFDWLETAIIALSPAAWASVYFGQTGNLAAGLLLLALAAPRGGPVAAALLTIKPQAGFLLPVLWAIERKFVAIAIAGGVAIALGALALVLFGPAAWRDYLGPTLGLLNTLEREGEGGFMAMIPSVFIGMRNIVGDATIASYVHWAVAAAAATFAIWAMLRADDERGRWAIVIAAMAVITPYIHIYDLAPVLVAALIVFNRWQPASTNARAIAALVMLFVWALPLLTVLGNKATIPVGPIVPIALLIVSAIRVPNSSSVPSLALTEKSQS
jgi:hypothetical protein